tara:strand:- start:2212 stop:2466 length:255 start_codon:yes stop_codon:yes gene_type:complete
MSWEKIIKAVPDELKEFIESSREHLSAFKDEMDYFYSNQNDAGLLQLLDEADKTYESLNDIIFEMYEFLEVLEQNKSIMQEELQ